jgi:hypothetical protein
MKFSTVLVLAPFALAAPSAVHPNVEIRAVAVGPSSDVVSHVAIEARCSKCQNVVSGIVGAIDNLGNSIEDNLQNLRGSPVTGLANLSVG